MNGFCIIQRLKSTLFCGVTVLLIGCEPTPEEIAEVARDACQRAHLANEREATTIIDNARAALKLQISSANDAEVSEAIDHGLCREYLLNENYASLLTASKVKREQIRIEREKYRADVVTATCNVMQQTSLFQSTFRLTKINEAREKIEAPLFLGTDKEILEAFEYDLCAMLVSGNKAYSSRLAELKEAERLAAEKEAHEEYLASVRLERLKKENKARFDEAIRSHVSKIDHPIDLLGISYSRKSHAKYFLNSDYCRERKSNLNPCPEINAKMQISLSCASDVHGLTGTLVLTLKSGKNLDETVSWANKVILDCEQGIDTTTLMDEWDDSYDLHNLLKPLAPNLNDAILSAVFKVDGYYCCFDEDEISPVTHHLHSDNFKPVNGSLELKDPELLTVRIPNNAQYKTVFGPGVLM